MNKIKIALSCFHGHGTQKSLKEFLWATFNFRAPKILNAHWVMLSISALMTSVLFWFLLTNGAAVVLHVFFGTCYLISSHKVENYHFLFWNACCSLIVCKSVVTNKNRISKSADVKTDPH